MLGVDIGDLKCQGYDNGSNMKGKHKIFQKKSTKVNPMTFTSTIFR